MAYGRLSVSIVEARNVVADTQADLDFYIRLRLGAQDARTEICRGSLTPRFMKDFSLKVDGPGSQALQVELLQRGPHGDLVVGSADIPLSTLKERETMVQWVEVKGPARSAMGAELHAVLRLSPRAASRASTPNRSPAAVLELPQPGTPPRPAVTTMPSSKLGDSIKVHSPAAPASLRASAAKSEGSPSGGAAAVRASSQHPLRASLVGLQQALASNIATNASTPVPTPLAVAGSMVLGALLYLLRRPPAEGGVWDRPGRKQLGHSYRKNYGADYWRSAERLRAQRK